MPDGLERGEEARLIPVLAESNKEQKTASVFLATLMSVPAFASRMLSSIGVTTGKTTKVRCYTEVIFDNNPAPGLRPDGYIIVSTGKRLWSAIVETKIGRSEIERDQLQNYCLIAKSNRIDAVLTISNQMVGQPTHLPVTVPAKYCRNISLYHWSWMMVRTIAQLCLNEEEFSNEAERWILREATRFFEHDSAGIHGFTQMNPDWKKLVVDFQSGIRKSASSEEVADAIAAWHQEVRDICLLMTRETGSAVREKISRLHRSDPNARTRDDGSHLVQYGQLRATLQIPGAADLEITADVNRRTIAAWMRLRAPTDRQRHTARVNWLIKQLRRTEDDAVDIIAHWPGKALPTKASLRELREGGPSVLLGQNSSLTPHSFDICMQRDLAAKFSGRRAFISELEALVPHFYEQVGQHLRPFVPPAPRVVERASATEQAVVTKDQDEVHEEAEA